MVQFDGRILSARLVYLTVSGRKLFEQKIFESGKSLGRIAMEADVSIASIRRFFRGGTIRSTTFSKISLSLLKDEDLFLDDRYVVAVDPNRPWPKSFKRAA